MIALRTAGNRGYADHGWLQSWHSFVRRLHDPAEMGWGAARHQRGRRRARRGLPDARASRHGDRHGDSRRRARASRQPRQRRRYPPRRGATHECRSRCQAQRVQPSPEVATHLLQIWIRPARSGATPGCEQREISLAPGATLLASPDGRDGSVAIGQDATLQRVRLVADEIFVPDLAPDRFGYAHLIPACSKPVISRCPPATASGARCARAAPDGRECRRLPLSSTCRPEAGTSFCQSTPRRNDMAKSQSPITAATATRSARRKPCAMARPR